MTCIVGLVDKGIIYMGGDSAGTDERLNQLIRDDPKVFRNDQFIIGFTSSFRMGQLLRFKFTPPKRYQGENDYEYMVGRFVDEVRSCFKAGGYLTIKENQESGGTFLVGYHKQLYSIYSDFQVGINNCGYAACGCGDLLALGALAANTHLSPDERIKNALEIAEKFSAGVRRPFVFEKLEEVLC